MRRSNSTTREVGLGGTFAKGLCLVFAWGLALLTGCANFHEVSSDHTSRWSKLLGGGSAERIFSQEFTKGRNAELAGRFDEARHAYEQLIVEYPRRYEPYHRLGVVADSQRRHREAEVLYTEAIARQPRSPELFNDLGYCFYLQGKLDKAESALAKAVALAPSIGRFRNNLGLAYAHQRRYDEALESFRRAGSEADAQYNLAFVLTAQDNVDGAKDCFRRALAADPTCEKARAALESFERFERDPEGLYANSEMVKNGVRYVPYVEGATPNDISAEAYAQNGASPSGSPHSAAGPTSNISAPANRDNSKLVALQQRAQNLLEQRLSTSPR